MLRCRAEALGDQPAVLGQVRLPDGTWQLLDELGRPFGRKDMTALPVIAEMKGDFWVGTDVGHLGRACLASKPDVIVVPQKPYGRCLGLTPAAHRGEPSDLLGVQAISRALKRVGHGAHTMTGYGERGMLALLFPGQGSQRPGMGQAWRATPAWGVVDEVSEATGRDVGHLLNDADAEELKATRNSQLATFTLSLVILDGVRRAVAGMDEQVTAMAGHSLGEYAALVASGALNRLDGARLVKARGEATQAAADADPGTMAAVLGLDVETVAKMCAEAVRTWVANDNAPGQVVIAGTTAGVKTASKKAKELGAKRVLPLSVGGAFHSPLMAPAQAGLDAALAVATFAAPAVPVVANVDARAHTDEASWPQLLSQQLCHPVRWRESLVAMDRMGVTIFVELGAGTELSGMVKRTLDGATRAHVATPEDLLQLSEHLDAAR